MDLVPIKLGKYTSKGFGFKVQESNGKLVVSQVLNDGAAFKNGLCCDDVIYSINNENAQMSANDLLLKMTQIKGDVQLLVYRRDLQRSYNNLSALSGAHNSNSSQKLTSSMSASNLLHYEPTKHVFPTADDINDYLYPVCTADSTDISPEPPFVQITRKQGYKKPTNDMTGSLSPRYSVKKATKSSSVYGKDPNITIKKRFKPKLCDTLPTVSNISQKSRDHVDAPHSLSSSHLSSLTDNRIEDFDYHTQLSVPEYQLHSYVNNIGLDESSKSTEFNQLEVDLKILSFTEKVKKPAWCKFMIENDALGVLFYGLDANETQMACNSTAINPYVSGLDFYMERWYSNNTISRFFLPIGQQPYHNEIEVSISIDYIQITYCKYNIEFWINFSKLPDDKTAALFTLFGVTKEVPEPKHLQMKTKRYHTSMDNIRLDSRKQQVDKHVIDSTRDKMLSSLPQTKLVQNVPLILVICINIIEKLGIKNEGIYRKSGNEGARRRLENVVNSESVDKWADYDEWTNVNTVCSLLKSVLRSYSLIERDTAIKLSMINLGNVDEFNQKQVYMDMIYHLRQQFCKTDTRTDHSLKDRTCRLEMFKYLMKHLDRVTRYEEYNKMSADNLATCFWPTIIQDIPASDDGEYQTSKKSDTDRNLKQMVVFWITYADLVCKLLDEDDDTQRYKKLVHFSLTKDRNPNHKEKQRFIEVEQHNISTTIREQIEYYTAQSFMPSGNSSLDNLSAPNTPEIRHFARLRTHLGLDHSFKQSKRDQRVRRKSTSLSPTTSRKMIQLDLDAELPQKGFSPMTRKKLEDWASRNVRSKKKEPVSSNTKELTLQSLLLSSLIEKVPFIIELCVTIVNCYGLDVDGIYRINGSKNELNTLEDLVLNNDPSNWYNKRYLSMWSNVYNVSCLLKYILKKVCLIKKDTWIHMATQFADTMERNDVPNVLMAAAYHLHNKKRMHTDTISVSTEKELENDIRSATLRYVLRHLKGVSHHVNNSRMSTNALAVCFMPVILEEDVSENFMASHKKCIQIMEKLIDHSDWIFQWDDTPLKDEYSDAMRESVEEYLVRHSVTDIDNKVPKTDDVVIYQQTIDTDKIFELLKSLVANQHIVTASASTSLINETQTTAKKS